MRSPRADRPCSARPRAGSSRSPAFRARAAARRTCARATSRATSTGRRREDAGSARARPARDPAADSARSSAAATPRRARACRGGVRRARSAEVPLVRNTWAERCAGKLRSSSSLKAPVGTAGISCQRSRRLRAHAAALAEAPIGQAALPLEGEELERERLEARGVVAATPARASRRARARRARRGPDRVPASRERLDQQIERRARAASGSIESGGVIASTRPSSPEGSTITPRRSAPAQARAARSRVLALDREQQPEAAHVGAARGAGAGAAQVARARASPVSAARSTSFSSSITASEASAAAQPGGCPRKVCVCSASPRDERPGLHHLEPTEAGRDRHAGGEALARAQQIRDHALVLAGEPAPGATEAGVDLVRDQQPAFAHRRARAARPGSRAAGCARRRAPAPARPAPRRRARGRRSPRAGRPPRRRSARTPWRPAGAPRTARGSPDARWCRARPGSRPW